MTSRKVRNQSYRICSKSSKNHDCDLMRLNAQKLSAHANCAPGSDKAISQICVVAESANFFFTDSCIAEIFTIHISRSTFEVFDLMRRAT
jgi:hypothetical protein